MSSDSQYYSSDRPRRSGGRRSYRRKRGDRSIADSSSIRDFDTREETKTEDTRHERPSSGLSSSSSLIEIDGSALEGGGQVLRNSMALSVLSGQSIRISKVRGGRRKPGLQAQHLTGIELCQKINGGRLYGNEMQSLQVEYHPNPIIESSLSSSSASMKKRWQWSADTKTAGSVCLLLQIAFPFLLFHPNPSRLTLIGGTNASFAPPIDYTLHVFRPMFNRLFNQNDDDDPTTTPHSSASSSMIDITILKRGFFPRGQGKLSVDINPLKKGQGLPSFEMIHRGELTRIQIHCVVSRMSESEAHQMCEVAESELRKHLRKKYKRLKRIEYDLFATREDGRDIGSACLLIAQSEEGAMIAASSLGSFGRKGNEPSEMTAKNAVKNLMNELDNGDDCACVDEYMQDQLIIFMALAKGISKLCTPPLSTHTQTAIYYCQRIIGAKFNIIPAAEYDFEQKKPMKSIRSTFDDCSASSIPSVEVGAVVIECQGIGYHL